MTMAGTSFEAKLAILFIPPRITMDTKTSSFPRYITAKEHVKYLVVIPMMALIHIQNRAPGPPMEMAMATPAILPIPIVEDSAVDNA